MKIPSILPIHIIPVRPLSITHLHPNRSHIEYERQFTNSPALTPCADGDTLNRFRRRARANPQPSASSDTPGKPASPSKGGKERQERGVFYGWWIVLAGSVSQAYTSGTFWQGLPGVLRPHNRGVRLEPSAHGGRDVLQRTESGAISPFVGWFIDKFGPRNVMLFGTFLTALGFILLSRIQELWQSTPPSWC